MTPFQTESRPVPAVRTACLLIADDLTGACDSAVHFAAAGFPTFVPLAPEHAPGAASVLAFSSESRDIEPAAVPRRLLRLSPAVRFLAPRIIFKKIDSTLRGNTALEIIAALDAFDCDAAVVNPAFPAMGRIVESGFLRLPADPGFRPIEIGPWLRAHGATACRYVRLGAIADALDSGARFISLDAVCPDDLARIAAELLSERRRILWAGSAGLAAALAPALGNATPAAVFPPPFAGSVLFCIGSDHPVTADQQRRILAHRDVALLDAQSATADELASALRTHVVLRIPRGRIDALSLAALLSNCRPAAFLLSGGDTAALVCKALGVQSVELRREFAPGIPLGVFHGGPVAGSPVVTKSGGFGAPDDLIHLADYFHA